MSGESCCVCGVAVGAAGVPHEGRLFCRDHHARLMRRRRGLASATGWLVLGLAALTGAVVWASPALRSALSAPALATLAVVLALVPAALWIVVFYAQDREPEPKTLVLKVFVLGGVLAAAVGQPLIGAFDLWEWARGGIGSSLLAGILVVGVVQEALKYAAVRYSVYPSPAYDQPIDGIVYAAAAGLGYATAANLQWTFEVGVPDPGAAAARFAVVTLGHASYAAVVGYFLGRAKFEEHGGAWLPAGLLAAAVANGVGTAAVGIAGRRGLRPTPHWGLLVAAVVAAATFAAATWLLRRGRTSRVSVASSTAFRWRREAAVWSVVGALLLAAAALRAGSARETRAYEGRGMSLRYPAAWTVLAEGTTEEPLHAGDLDEGVAAPTSVRVRTVPLRDLAAARSAGGDGAGPTTVGDLVIPWCERQRGALLGYRIFDLERAEVGGRLAMVLESSHVAEAVVASTTPALPEVVRATEVLWLDGEDLVVVSLSTRAESWHEREALRRRVLSSVRWEKP
jgi:RsiW-degrading membrane proteinase PrsW (M82 family)